MAHYITLSKPQKASITYIILFFFTLNYFKKNLLLFQKLSEKYKIINKISGILSVLFIIQYFLEKLQHYFVFSKIFFCIKYVEQKSSYCVKFIIIYFGYFCYEMVSFPIFFIFNKVEKLSILVNLNNFLMLWIFYISELFMNFFKNLRNLWFVQIFVQIYFKKALIKYIFSEIILFLVSFWHTIVLSLGVFTALLTKDYREFLFEKSRILIEYIINFQFNFKEFFDSFLKSINNIKIRFYAENTIGGKISYIFSVFFYILCGLFSIFEFFQFVRKHFYTI